MVIREPEQNFPNQLQLPPSYLSIDPDEAILNQLKELPLIEVKDLALISHEELRIFIDSEQETSLQAQRLQLMKPLRYGRR